MKMRRVIMFVLTVLALCSCAQDFDWKFWDKNDDTVGSKEIPEDGKVTIEFSVPGFTAPETKALGEGGVLNNLYVAVFGSSGYLKEYAQAYPERVEDYTYPTVDKDSTIVYRTVPCYKFSVTIAMSDSPRTIHFLGNGPSTLPFGYDNAVIPMQLSSDGEMSYWQTIHLPHGIQAKRNSDGYFIDRNGNVIPEGGSGYIADSTTLAAFKEIPLIRNWAKIEISSLDDSNFTPYSFAVVNVPSRGSIAPYSAETGFLENYQDLGFAYLEDSLHYAANLPSGTTFDMSIPDSTEFLMPTGERVSFADGGSVYLYERPAPSPAIPQSYVIIYGHYHNPSDSLHWGNYYYKVDLMETRSEIVDGQTSWYSDYYPIYRNFKYQIVVKKILAPGQSTPAAAAASAGSADVSADISTGHLADISDGVGRLHVTPWMSQTFTDEHDENNPVQVLNAWFGSIEGEPIMETDKVRVDLLAPTDGGSDNILYNLSIGPASEEQGSRGWRQISFCNVAPGRTVRSQTLRITATHEYGRLYRDVTITIQPIQKMSMHFAADRIPAEIGASQTVTVNIPDGLVESMFPLEFVIEAEDMNLTPDNKVPGNNLPVISGTSISEHPGYAGKPAFQFLRTITWNDYLGLARYQDDDEMMWRSFDCYFRTNIAESGTTVWVQNEYFDKTSATFTHFNYKSFVNLGINVPIPMESEAEIPLSFEMVEDPDGIYPLDYPRILISVRGLRCISEGITPGPYPESYYYKPESHLVELTFITTTNDGDIAVDLYANDYEDGHVKAYEFPFAGLLDGHPLSTSNGNWANNLWSNVAWGYVNKDDKKTILFGYKDHPDKINTPVTLSILSGLQEPKVIGKAITFPYTPTGPRHKNGDKTYHEIELRTITGLRDVTFSLSSPGYITKTFTYGRFQGNIRTMKITSSNVLMSGNSYGFTQDNPQFTYSEDNGKVNVVFDKISTEPTGYIHLDAGETYTMTITSKNSNQTLFYVDFFFQTSGTTIFDPESFTPSVGTIERYPGSNNQYVWHIPRGHLSASVTLTPREDRYIRITTLYIKSMNGSVYKDGIVVP